MSTLDAQTELERFLRRATGKFAEIIKWIARSIMSGRHSTTSATNALTVELTEMMTLAHMKGARRVLLETDEATGGKQWSNRPTTPRSATAATPFGGALPPPLPPPLPTRARAGTPPPLPPPVPGRIIKPPPLSRVARAKVLKVVPRIPFKEAIDDLVRREPRFDSRQTWLDVAEQYQNEHVFAATRASSLEVTERVQKAVEDLLVGGQSEATAVKVLAEIDEWSDSYAKTVFRTNAATAYSQGRLEEAERPLVKEAMPARERFSAQDVDVRDNHQAGHGFIAATDDPIWLSPVRGGGGVGPVMPPSGFGCRCSDRLVTREELEQRNLLLPGGGVKRFFPPGFAGYFPDPGFEAKFRGVGGA